MRRLFCVFLILASMISCVKNSESSSDLISLVPPKTAVILKTKNLPEFADNFTKNPLIVSNSELPIIDFFRDRYSVLSSLQLSDESLITFSKIGRDEIATTIITPTTPVLLDSIGYEEIQGFKYNGKEIKEYLINKKTIYGVKLNGNFAFGDSKLIIENIVRLSQEQFQVEEELAKIFKSSSGKKNSVFLNLPEFENIAAILTPNRSFNFLQDFGNWIGLDLEIKNNRFKLNGVSIPQNNKILGILNNTQPQKNEIAKICPLGASGFYSVTFDHYQQLSDNLSFYHKKDSPNIDKELMEATSEFGMIYLGDSEVFVLKTEDRENIKELLETDAELLKTYRDHEIYEYQNPDYFFRALTPLVQNQKLSFFTSLDNFFVFSENQNTLENIISNYQNKSLISESEAFKKTIKQLDEKSSLLLVGLTKNFSKKIPKAVSSEFSKSYESIDFSGFNIAAIQFIRHDHFTFVNADMQAIHSDPGIAGGIQIQNLKPGEDIIAGPWFFQNWRTGNYEVVVQGKSNQLYVFDENGKFRWKKQIDGPVLGDIQPIDIYQNKRIQMTFVTPQTFYIIDREGKVVKPFNKTFKNTITQPLSVFDYNKNGTFRFLIVQDKKLSMYDKQLNPVKGFEFTQADSKILQNPVHYRLGNKDYILIPEESGKLNVLNPRGQTRLKVDRNIDFSANPWFLYNDLFTSTTKDGQLIQVDQQGKINIQNLKLDEHHHIYATSKTLTTFSENILNIKGKSNKLDYGLYLKPKIFYLKDKLFISITDSQAHKTYLFDSTSNLLKGFPVYGNSEIDLQVFPDGNIRLAVKGEENSILLYEVQ